MTGDRHDPVGGYNFVISLVEASSALLTLTIGIGRPPQAGFSECSGLEMTMQPEEYREGGRNGAVLKFPSRVSWSNIRLRRGVATTNDLWDWHYSFVEGRGKRRDGVITLQNDQREQVRAWRFRRGLPVKWSGPTMHASQNQIAIEELEIAHEGLQAIPASGGTLFDTVGNLLGL